MKSNRCLFCQGKNFSELVYLERFPLFFGAIPYREKKNVESYPLTIAICQNCSLVQQINLLDIDAINKVYTANYYNCPSPVATGMGTREINKFLSFFKYCNLEVGRLLEIACFDGYLLKNLKIDGWDVYGIDPSSMTKIAMEELGGDKVINQFFLKDMYPAESFDVIVFRNLLEHLYDIHDFIDAVSRCLKPGGRIFIDVPNVKALIDIGGFGTFFHQHISYFSIQTLSSLLEKHDFFVEEYSEGTPNLFVSAIKNDSFKKKKLSDEKFNIDIVEGEVKLFLLKNNRIKKTIDNLFSDEKYKRIAIFGASALATCIINYLSKASVSKIKFIFDNDQQKHEKFLFGCDVVIDSPTNIESSQFDAIVVATYFFDDEIKKQLVDSGIDDKKIINLKREI